MATVEQNIIDEIIKVTLPKINGEDGYSKVVDAENIYDGYLSKDSSGEFPYLCVVDESQTKFSQRDSEGNIYVSGGKDNNMLDGWPLEIYGYVKTKTGEVLAEELRKLQNDIIKAMLADKKRGGHAWGTSLLGYVKTNNYRKHNDIGEVIVVFSIKYQLGI